MGGLSAGTMSSLELVKQGAEARVYSGMFLGRKCIVKERFPKTYRHPELDRKLTLRRTLTEARTMAKCLRTGELSTPAVYFLDRDRSRIVMEYVEGITVRDFLNAPSQDGDGGAAGVRLAADFPFSAEAVMDAIGACLAVMHRENIVHGDLTTSNLMLRRQPFRQGDEAATDAGASAGAATPALVLIDFGLSSVSTLAEDKAVDLYVLERAFLSTHPGSEDLFARVLDKYEAVSSRKAAKFVLDKLAEVRMRGRKRSMLG